MIDIETSSALDIINYMDASGWFFLVANNTVGNISGGIKRPDSKKFAALFGKSYQKYYPEHAGTGDDLTEAIRNGAKKALERGW